MSFKVCKILFSQMIFKVLNKKSFHFDSSKLMSQTNLPNVGEQAEVSQKFNRLFIDEDKNCCRNFIENYISPPVPWEILEQNLTAIKSANIRSTILKSCQVLQKEELAIDYCQYIIDKGEKLSLIETCLLIKIFVQCENDVKKYDKLIKTIYEHSHDTIFGLEIIVKEALEVFCKNNCCLQDVLLKFKEGKIHASGIGKLIAALFDADNPELAWKIAKENPEKFSYSSVKSYLEFCIRLAEKKNFSIDLINDLINFSKTYTVVFVENNFFDDINQLVEVLNKSDTGYLWIANKCDLIRENLCSSCHYNFKPETVTVEELEELKKNFMKKVIISSNINIKTTPKEFEKFSVFLENCRPYNIVIDVLNLFQGSNYEKRFSRQILSYFERQGMEILLIGRHHFKNSSFYNKVKENYQIFLTRNDSLDDLFCIYAAMHQGLNTYFCTSDFLRDHAKFFCNHFLRALFHKWQISHQYVFHLPDQKILHPRYHSDISQFSVVLDKSNKMEKYYWHLSYLENRFQYRIQTPAKWICLRADPLKRRNESKFNSEQAL